MSSRLVTIEGVYDGKHIQPLDAVKTSKKHRVLITFLDEIEQQDDSLLGKGLAYIPDELAEQLRKLAHDSGVNDVRSFVIDVLRETVRAAKTKEFVYAVTDEIRAGLAKAGISEEEVLQDFNRFRRALPRE